MQEYNKEDYWRHLYTCNKQNISRVLTIQD